MAKHAPRGPLKAKADNQKSSDTATIEPPAKAKRGKPEAVRQAAIFALLTSPSVAAAADVVGVEVHTLHRWLAKDKAFIAAYMQATDECFQSGMMRLRGYSGQAVDRMHELMTEKAFPSTSYQAARDVLDRTMGRATETIRHEGEITVTELVGRLDRAKQRAKSQNP